MVGANRKTLLGSLIKVPFLLLALTMIVPYYWMVIGAFKPVPELIRNPPTFFIEQPTLNNFYDPLGNTPPNHVAGLFQRLQDARWGFGSYFFNSVFITISVTVLALLIASATAYVLAKQRIPGRHLLFIIIISSMMVPWQVTLIPNFLTVRNLDWLNTYWALIIPALPKAFAVFFLRQYLLSMPNELLDAARIDGAGEVRIWWSIVLPLIRPALTAMAIFILLAEWNNFLWPLIVVQDGNHATLPLALARLNSNLLGPQTMGVMMVAALLASLPTVVFFLIFQRQFVEGITFSGTKG